MTSWRTNSQIRRAMGFVAVAALRLVLRAVGSDWLAMVTPVVGLLLATFLAVGDAVTGRIPNRQVACALVAAGVVLAGSAVAVGSIDLVVRSLLGAFLAAGPWLAFALATSNRVVGGGDVKLAALLGLSLGPIDLLAVEIHVALAMSAWVVLALIARRRQRDRFVFGPALVGSAILAVVVCAVLQRSGVVLDIQRLGR